MSGISVGVTLDGFHIDEEVGRGGMATVYRARQLAMDRDVALKALPTHLMNHAVSLDRFKQEASIVARLEHRAIVPVYHYGEYDGVPYLVMRFMDGGSVDDLLEAGPMEPTRALAIMQQIAPGLDYAHRQDVLHRDLKPSNILMDRNGDAYITDFGIARILKPDAKPLTTSGVVGTPSYMSPEQAQGHALDGRSDVYALGVLLFEMLTGERPFEGDTPYSVAVKHVTEPVPSACAINPKLSTAVEHVLYKALAKRREMRYQTAVEMVAALAAALEATDDIAAQTLEAAAESAIETEPSLRDALSDGAARRGVVLDNRPVTGGATVPPVPPASLLLPSPPSDRYPALTGHSATGIRGNDASGRVRSPDRRTRRRTAPTTLWFVAALVVASLLLAVVVSGIYYVTNLTGDDAATTGRDASPDYYATAVFKLTATDQGRDAITTPTPFATSETPLPLLPFTTLPVPDADTPVSGTAPLDLDLE